MLPPSSLRSLARPTARNLSSVFLPSVAAKLYTVYRRGICVFCILYTIHYTLCNVHCTFGTLYTVHFTLYFVLYTVNTVHYTLCTLSKFHCDLGILHFTLYVCKENYTVYSAQSSTAVQYSVQCTVYTIHQPLHTIHRALHTEFEQSYI